MADNSKSKTAVEVARALSKAMRAKVDEFNKLEKNEFTPREAGLQVTAALRKKISEHYDHLAQMRKMESEPLVKALGDAAPNMGTRAGAGVKVAPAHVQEPKPKYSMANHVAAKAALKPKAPVQKSLHGLASSTPSNAAVVAPVPAQKKNVFDILSSAQAQPVVSPVLGKADLELKSDDEKNEEKINPALPGAVLPSDKPAKDLNPKKSGTGGEIKKGKKLSKAEASPILSKTFGIKPKLGGKDDASLHMSHGAAMDIKNKKMPAGQQKVKMPSMEEHASRAADLAEFTPKWNKSELMKDMEAMEGYCKAKK